MSNLMHDLGLTSVQSAGILGNIGHECAGFEKLQEVKPLGGGAGGWGWCQWTGPRRTEFEKWAAANGRNPKDDKTNYDFMLFELNGPESGSLRSLKRTQTVETATSDFMHKYERPGVEALSSRNKFANLAYQEYTRAYND
jgi:hypothetical protein